MTIRPLRTVLLVAALSGLCAPALAPAEPAADAVVATVGGEKIRYDQLLERGRDALASQQQEQELQLLRQQEAAARERHGVLESTLGQLLDERALALEAKARGSTPDLLLAQVSAEPVTDEQSRMLYLARKGESDPDWAEVQAQLGPRIRQYLAAQHQEEARRKYLDGLRLKHGIVSALAPYRATVPTGGAARGPATARVSVVEFGDYQCPHCAHAQGIVQGLLVKHAGTLRVEFHQFPLERIHPDARNAALAATCARAQGRFWEYHDALYADPSNLGLARLQSTAESQGLDGKRFAACIQAPATAQAVTDDLRAGAVAGVNGTPAFYVNGRPVPADADELERVVAEELAAGAGAH